MILYLAGPMRGYPRYNFDAFEAAYKRLTDLGYEVLSPHKMDLEAGFDPDKEIPENELKAFTLEAFKRDMDAICKADALIFLPGWNKSVGATAEKAVAKWLGKHCYGYAEKTRVFFDIDYTSNLKRAAEAECPENILETANRLIHGARQKHYGHPADDFRRTAKMATGVLIDKLIPGSEVSPEDIPKIMVCVKLSRLCNHYHKDSVVDIAGYAGTMEMQEERKHEAPVS